MIKYVVFFNVEKHTFSFFVSYSFIEALSNLIYTIFRAKRITFFLVNRVKNQNEPKRPQSGGRLGSFWFSTRPTAMGSTDYKLYVVSEAL